MNDLKLGEIITTEQKRDAVHVAVVPVIAGEDLEVGMHVGLVPGSTDTVMCASPKIDRIGIVDPFLSCGVDKGQRFWLFLYPGTITSLRHDWSHPAFPATAQAGFTAQEKHDSEQWMQAFAAKHFEPYRDMRQFTAEDLVAAGFDFLKNGERYVQQGSDSLRDDTSASEFWYHFERITGMQVPEYHRSDSPFCCTC